MAHSTQKQKMIKTGEMEMTVYVSSNVESKKSFVLTFQNGVTPNDIRRILKQYKQDAAIRMLISRSSGVMAVRPESRKTVEHIADFVVGDSYTAERLA